MNSSHVKASDAKLWCFLWLSLINGWVNNGEAGDLWRHRTHYEVTVMIFVLIWRWSASPLPPPPQDMYSTVAVYQIGHFQTVCSEWYLKQLLFRRKHFGGLLAYNKITMTYLIEFRISHIFLLSVDFVGNFAKYPAVLFKCKRIEVAATLKSPAENYWGCMLIGYGYWILLWFTQAYFLSYERCINTWCLKLEFKEC